MRKSIRYLGFTVGLLLLFLVAHNVHFGVARGINSQGVVVGMRVHVLQRRKLPEVSVGEVDRGVVLLGHRALAPATHGPA